MGWLSQSDYTYICVVRGSILLPGNVDHGEAAEGQLHLWYHEMWNDYCITASWPSDPGNEFMVCELLKSKFHFVQY